MAEFNFIENENQKKPFDHIFSDFHWVLTFFNLTQSVGSKKFGDDT